MLRLAIPKGKYLFPVCQALATWGYEVVWPHERQYSIDVGRSKNIRLYQAKMRDIPLLLRESIVDAGIVGDEWVAEQGLTDCLFRMADTGIYHARIVLVSNPNAKSALLSSEAQQLPFSVFTKYPSLTSRCMMACRVPFRIVPLAGVVEGLIQGARSLGVVCSETGATLRLNGLLEIKSVLDCSLCIYAAPWLVGESEKWGIAEALVASARVAGGGLP